MSAPDDLAQRELVRKVKSLAARALQALGLPNEDAQIISRIHLHNLLRLLPPEPTDDTGPPFDDELEVALLPADRPWLRQMVQASELILEQLGSREVQEARTPEPRGLTGIELQKRLPPRLVPVMPCAVHMLADEHLVASVNLNGEGGKPQGTLVVLTTTGERFAAERAKRRAAELEKGGAR